MADNLLRVVTVESRRAKGCLIGGAFLSAMIAVLFVIGDGVQHTVYDRWAIVLVIAQCLLVGAALQEKPKPPLQGA